MDLFIWVWRCLEGFKPTALLEVYKFKDKKTLGGTMHCFKYIKQVQGLLAPLFCPAGLKIAAFLGNTPLEVH